MSGLVVREYGTGMGPVITLHGGPAAAGDVAPLAQELGKRWHVLEPFQRGSGDGPLTVARHVQDLDDVIRERCAGARPVIVGHSWGAMLALAHAAGHSAAPAALALVGCGTFSPAARAAFKMRLHARLTPADLDELAEVERAIGDEDVRCAARGRLMVRVYACELDEPPAVSERVDAVAHEQTWADMMRLQQDGTYPAAFAAIQVPVLMLHGDADPHPGPMTRDDLLKQMPQLEYCELQRCGHYPWLERHAREPFFEALNAWLARRFGAVG